MKEKISELVQKQDLLEGKYDQLKDENALVYKWKRTLQNWNRK